MTRGRIRGGTYPENSSVADFAEGEERDLTRRLRVKQLRDETLENRHFWAERFRRNFELLLVFALWGGALMVFLMMLVWALHMCGLRWLDEPAFEKLQSFVLGGVVTGVLGKALEKRLR